MAIHAPYHFVPLSPWIYAPPWGYIASRDIPFADGISGELHITLTNHSPLMIGGETVSEDGQPKKVTFLKDPNGNPCIPGTSLRGMIRNVLEIATFSKMQMVDEQRFGFRDFNIKKYQQLAGDLQKKTAGWLKFTKGKWCLYPIKHHQVKHSKLKKLIDELTNIQLTEVSAKQKYDFFKGKLTQYYEYKDGNLLLQAKGGSKGFIVFTGPMDKKAYDYIFEPPNDKPSQVVPTQDVTEFIHAHQHRTSSRDKQSEDDLLTFLINNQGAELPGVPVFYSKVNGRLMFGLAKAPKITTKTSIHNAIKTTNAAHINQSSLFDMAETIFGTTSKTSSHFYRKTRVSFSDFICTQKEPNIFVSKEAILGQPRASYYPSYLEQGNTTTLSPFDHIETGKQHSTFLDTSVKIRGWKRYPAQSEVVTDSKKMNINQSDNSNIKSIFHAIDEGSTFEGKLKFFNLKPIELGALLWSLTLENHKNRVHALGMAKPFGFGAVSLHINSKNVKDNQFSDQSSTPIDSWIKQFEAHMESAYIGDSWKNSLQIQALLAMSEKTSKNEVDLTYMELEQYTASKSKEKSRKEVLPYKFKKLDLRSNQEQFDQTTLTTSKQALIRGPFVFNDLQEQESLISSLEENSKRSPIEKELIQFFERPDLSPTLIEEMINRAINETWEEKLKEELIARIQESQYLQIKNKKKLKERKCKLAVLKGETE